MLSVAEYANSHTTVIFLETLQKHYSEKHLWVVWDNTSYNKSETVRQYQEKVNGQVPQNQWPLTLLHFAPNATEQNPIESVWLQGKPKSKSKPA